MKIIIFYVGLIIFVFFFIFAAIFWWQIRTSLNSSGDNIIFKVEKGESAKIIAEHLKNSNIIKNPFFFQLYVFLSLRQYALKSGEYELSRAMSIRDIADTIVLGGTNEILITIPEGFTLNELESYRFSNDVPQALADKPKSASLEGYLFPDTYRFFKDAKLPDVVNKMIANLENKLTSDLKMAIKNSSFTTYEVLTMASLIEKEVKSDSDREIVSGILWKRLKAK